MIRRIIAFFKRAYYSSNSERYCNYLRKKGILIGTGTHIDPQTSLIDTSRPSLIQIGDNCYMNNNFTLLTHDWVTNVFINTKRMFINSSGKVCIGNNVSFGQNVMVLKGVTIGDNCFIGAGSIVTKDIPANTIAVGAPCKVVMTLEEYYQKRLVKNEEEAFEYARSILERFNRIPNIYDFWEEFPLFIDGNKIEDYPEIKDIIKNQLGPIYEDYKQNHIAKYNGLNDFLKAAGVYEK